MTDYHSRVRWIMTEAIREASESMPEDDRIHPKVGALLLSPDLEIIARAHRNERCECNPDSKGGDHAERILLRKAELLGLKVEDTILVTTLEPCARRRPGKVACALRLKRTGLREVWIGALDPDPRMLGVGEEILRSAGIPVERFPDDLIRNIRNQNRRFIAQYSPLYSSTGDGPVLAKPPVA